VGTPVKSLHFGAKLKTISRRHTSSKTKWRSAQRRHHNYLGWMRMCNINWVGQGGALMPTSFKRSCQSRAIPVCGMRTVSILKKNNAFLKIIRALCFMFYDSEEGIRFIIIDECRGGA
jgi:hypothetical protein